MLPFSEKSLTCLEGKSITNTTETLFSSVPLSNSLFYVSDPELQRNKDTVRCAALGTGVPEHCQKQLTQTLIVRLLKTDFLPLILDLEKST